MSVNFFNIFSKKRVRVSHPTAPAFYAFHAGDLPSPGAEIFAFQPKFANPVFVISGPGKIVGSMRVTEPRPVIQHLALPTNAYQGVPVGALALQGLLTQTQSGELTDGTQ